MGLLVGMDEAGYGPNLGPLTISATAWRVPGPPTEFDLWSSFAKVLSKAPPRGSNLLHVADSKQVYTPTAGLASLERGVLAGLSLKGNKPETFQQLRKTLASDSVLGEFDEAPWNNEADFPLPTAAKPNAIQEFSERWRASCKHHDIELVAVRSEIVMPARFNKLTRQCNSKGRALSQLSLSLLREVWNPETDGPALVIADKHGGRNRYDDLLIDALDGAFVFRLEEGALCSRYRVGESEVRFQQKAESHLPVALASMVAKYLRELSMRLFNEFWCKQIPELKPTKGYPVDAKRFREQIRELQAELNIDDDVLWRER